MYKKMYRYSQKQYNDNLLAMGIIRIGTLYDFRRMEHNKGIADNQEGQKTVSYRINELHMHTANDLDTKNNIDARALEEFKPFNIRDSKDIILKNLTLNKRFDTPDCFILCTSKICSRETMSQFEGADSCVEIVEIESFYRVLTDTINSIIPVIFKDIHEVIYQTREENWNGENWGRHPAMIKGIEFRKQSELRAIWQPKTNRPIQPIILGDYRLGTFCRNI